MFPLSVYAIRSIAVVILLIYILFSLHYLYRQVWWKTLIKSAGVTFLLVFTTIFSVLLIALLDAMFIQ